MQQCSLILKQHYNDNVDFSKFTCENNHVDCCQFVYILWFVM